MIMERIDFYEKKETLHDEMLSYIRNAVEIAGGSISSKSVLGYIIISPVGYETTQELAIDEVKIDDGILQFHDANAIDESYAWYESFEILSCCTTQICDTVYEIIERLSTQDDFAEEKREEFTDYVESVFPGYSSRIDWDYFDNIDTMENNLMTQVHWWVEEQ